MYSSTTQNNTTNMEHGIHQPKQVSYEKLSQLSHSSAFYVTLSLLKRRCISFVNSHLNTNFSLSRTHSLTVAVMGKIKIQLSKSVVALLHGWSNVEKVLIRCFLSSHIKKRVIELYRL